MPIVVEAVTEDKYKEWVAEQKAKKISGERDVRGRREQDLHAGRAEGRRARRSTPRPASRATRPTARACRRHSRRWSAARSPPDRSPATSDIVVNGSKKNPAMVAWKSAVVGSRDRRRHHLRAQLVRQQDRRYGAAEGCGGTAQVDGQPTRFESESGEQQWKRHTATTARSRTCSSPERHHALGHDHEPQGHRHDVPVVQLHHVHHRRRHGAHHPRRAVPARPADRAARSSSISSSPCTA